jgi:molecular chaperone HscC
VVALDSRQGEGIVTGGTAMYLHRTRAEDGVANFKRTMGTDRVYSLGKRSFRSSELSSYVLDHVRALAEAHHGTPVRRAVITVPAYFNEAQKQDTLEAADLAGLHVARLITEPAAAALSYGLHEDQQCATFVVVDLGGGTFDVCVMEQFEGILQVRSVAGESQLGGNDFSNCLLDLTLHKANISLDDLSPDGANLLSTSVENAKKALTRWIATEVPLPPELGLAPVRVTREEFEKQCADLLRRMRKSCREALIASGERADTLDRVVLVGGATRMPCVVRLAAEVFGQEPRTLPDPDTLVARGAAIQAALLNQDRGLSDVVVTEVASHSLGVAEARQIGNQFRPGYFSPVIGRNTNLPTSRTETFSTLSPNQRKLLVEIFEGESRRTQDNDKLGEIVVDDIAPGPARPVLEITFTFDVSGLLEVSVKNVESGKDYREVFQRGQRKLVGEALERAQQRLRSLRVNPKMRPRYREALARAEALWKHNTGSDRDFIGQEIDRFEAALETHTPKVMDAALQRLYETCRSLEKTLQ